MTELEILMKKLPPGVTRDVFDAAYTAAEKDHAAYPPHDLKVGRITDEENHFNGLHRAHLTEFFTRVGVDEEDAGEFADYIIRNHPHS